ncbi:MAG: protease pro-enzyme activation domain-containing protein [Thermoplasmataceae archaeon]
MNSTHMAKILSVVIVMVMLFSGAGAIAQLTHLPDSSKNIGKASIEASATILDSHFMPVPVSPSAVSKNATLSYHGTVSVLVTFSFSNQSRLSSLLANLSSAGNPQYREFITRSQFVSEFSVPESTYMQAYDYFSQYPSVSVNTYSDRVSMQITGSASEIGSMFNTSIKASSGDSSRYFAASIPELPSFMATRVSQVTGFTNTPIAVQSGPFSNSVLQIPKGTTVAGNGYPVPVSSNGVQSIYGSDLQVAYDEQSLLNITYPTHEVIATILWAGTNSTNNPVGPFDPSDIYAYYNATLPSYEPHPKVFGVPLNGAAEPGVSASYDTTVANIENTLDLEMVGSTAPGSSIYNVYGPNATFESLDAAFAYILNPNSTYSNLNNVSVISNSWGGPEYNDTAWYEYLQEAQARGISVLASSGDSGDNPLSSKYTANPSYPGDYVQFPAAMAYNNFGVTAVGGTTLILGSTLHILNQTAWYESYNSTGGSPAGSAGGISSVFPEPSWQKNTEANNVLKGQGNGVPDIAAIGNNTIIYLSTNGIESEQLLGGTSVASPVEAGIVAEMNAVLNHYNQSNLGYLNPMIYQIANRQIAPLTSTSTTGYVLTGEYNSTLPLTAFYDVKSGRNHVYNASFGYDLVTGWGSIDAYNLTMYLLNVNYSGKDFALNGVENVFNLSALNVTSYLYNSSTGSYSTVNTYFNASIQQNMFIADALGAPLYWIQNVIYINGSQDTGWTMNYTGWVVYPFYGLYPTQTVYEYSYPLGKIVNLPHEFTIKTWLSNLSSLDEQTMNFEVNSQVLQIPVPGASYIIGSYNYTYFWQGKEYLNGPFPNNQYPGGLDPQFGLVGGPSGGLGEFYFPTSGNMSAYIWPLGTNSYIPASTAVYNSSVDQTGEMSYNLHWVRMSTTQWDLSILNGSVSQGVVSHYPQHTYVLTFTESGLPSGTEWWVNLSNGLSEGSTSPSIYFDLPNGPYSYSIATTLKIYGAVGSDVTVNGNNVNVAIAFQKVTYAVTFTENGLPGGTTWYVNITGESGSGPITSGSYTVSLTNGSYSFTTSTSDKVLQPSSTSGTFVVNGAPVSEPILFTAVVYTVAFTESGLPSGTAWYVNITGQSSRESSSHSLSFELQNGSYSYTVATANKDYKASTRYGSFPVDGGDVSRNSEFLPVLYNVSLVEVNLPTGTSWTASLNGSSQSTTSRGMNFSETNGTYTFSISNLTDYYASDYLVSATVHGDNVTEGVDFLHYAYITGTLSPGNALLTVNGKSVPTVGGKFNISVAAGNYTIRASLQGYNPYSTNISLLNSQVKDLNITLASSSTPIPAGEEYGIIGGVVIAILGVGIYFVIRNRRH